MSDDDWPEGWEPLGMIEGDSPEVTMRKLNDYVRENFETVREVIFRNGARIGELRRIREPYELPIAHTHCTCTLFGILDPSIPTVRLYDERCGLLAHRLKARPPRQEQ